MKNISNEEYIKRKREKKKNALISRNTWIFISIVITYYILGFFKKDPSLISIGHAWLVVNGLSFVADIFYKAIFIKKTKEDPRRRAYYDYIYNTLGTLVILEMLYFQSGKLIIFIFSIVFVLVALFSIHVLNTDEEFYIMSMDATVAKEDKKYEKMLNKLNEKSNKCK